MKKVKTVKCPWCGKQVKLSKKGNILSHLVSTKVKCVGIGCKPPGRVA